MPLDAELSDKTIVDYIRRHASATIGELVEFTGVTATAVRLRLARLMEQGLVARESEASVGRGRPTHRYTLTSAGVRSGGTNYEQLTQALWAEVRGISDPAVRQGLLQRLSERLAESYRDKLRGTALGERMAELTELLSSQNLLFEVDQSEQLPVLKAMACPYPDLAEQDRGICAMEKMMLSSVLGESLRLSGCRLDGANCCTFESSATAN